ncbi:MAG TPA: sulfite oxidase, partial [Actinomycetota bacterium]|nr:sulfite oxidase [Actinomycetota bacterium]
HYLLIHFDIPHVDPSIWRLELGGNVRTELELTLDDLRSRPRVSITATLECAGNGRTLLEPRAISQPWILEAVGNAEWTGTPLAGVLEEAGLGEGSLEVLFSGADRGVQGEVEQDYERALPVAEAMREDVLLAYEMNGQPLLPQHGSPLRLLVPGWYGMTHVKWLQRITVLSEPFEGFQHTGSYRFPSSEDDPGTPVERIRPRSLLVPPGIPDFLSRRRFVVAGLVELVGRAWSGVAAIERVEVSPDGGSTWEDAKLDALPGSPYGWRGWSFAWDATPGDHELCCRATDGTGATQPLEPAWNLGGFANNAVQRVPVTVR